MAQKYGQNIANETVYQSLCTVATQE